MEKSGEQIWRGQGRGVKRKLFPRGTCHPVGKATDIKEIAIKQTEYCDREHREQWATKDHSPSPGTFAQRKGRAR